MKGSLGGLGGGAGGDGGEFQQCSISDILRNRSISAVDLESAGGSGETEVWNGSDDGPAVGPVTGEGS